MLAPRLLPTRQSPTLARAARRRAPAPRRALAALAPLVLFAAACTQSSPATVNPDSAGAPAVDPNLPSGGVAPGGATAAPPAGTAPGGTTAGGTTAGNAPPPASPPSADAPPGGGGRRAYPEFVQKMIERFQSSPPENPPRTVTRYDYKGQTVFYVSAPCCDHMSELYTSDGKLLCAPDGGITGRGDGKCTDFATAKKGELVVWQDGRKAGAGGKPPPKGKPTTTESPPPMPTKPAVTQ